MTNDVHRSASVGYERESGAYESGRPSYPAEAVTWLCTGLGLRPGDHVVELGAGTGIFTRSLLRAGMAVTAVEPLEAMRNRMTAAESGVLHRVEGTAEQTGLGSGCADAVFAATAWHWFDQDRAVREVRRLLRDDTRGGLGLIWNNYDCSIPWVAELADIAQRRRVAESPSATGAWQRFFAELQGWLPLREKTFANPWPTTPQGVVDRVLSSSAIASGSPEVQAQARQETWGVLAAHEMDQHASLSLPYTTACFWTRPG